MLAPILNEHALITVDPVAEGECLLNISQQMSNTVQVKVMAGGKFRIAGNLRMQKQ